MAECQEICWQKFLDRNFGKGELYKAEVGVGFATADSNANSSTIQAQGSTIEGGGNVSLYWPPAAASPARAPT